MRLAALIVAFAAFVAISIWLVHDEGLAGLFVLLRDDDWGRQVFMDLATALMLSFLFVKDDARRLGLRVWPWLVVMLLIGSPGLFGYAIRRELHLRKR